DVVAKDPEVEHVPTEMQPSAMQEHRDQDADEIHGIERRNPEAGRNESDQKEVALDVRTEGELPEKDKDVRRDQDIVDDRDGAARIAIGERDHSRRILCSVWGTASAGRPVKTGLTPHRRK